MSSFFYWILDTIMLSRTEFRNGVYKRDNYSCVICGVQHKDNTQDHLDAHHILERRLFNDGGYYIDNGATLCSEHHLMAESTDLSCEEIRIAAGISDIVLPDNFYSDLMYDKWGNILGKTNMPGPLFWDESVQKIMGTKVNSFSKYIKYPRTYHLPWSQPNRKSDRYLKNDSYFTGRRVVITEKMDGENTTLYNDNIHARSIDGKNHPSRDWIKNYHSNICHDIPNDIRVCGENMYAKHTVEYNNLTSYFYGFSVWSGPICLSWDETLEYFELLEIPHVPIVADGIYEDVWNKTNFKSFNGIIKEGYVIRLADSFMMNDFSNSVAKYVGQNFILPHAHWIKTWEKNKLCLEN